MKVIFLDRDGVISKYYHGDYTKTWAEFKFLPGAKEALTKLRKTDFTIFIISNQSGVSKGVYSLKALSRITSLMEKEIEKSGGKIKKSYYCVHQEVDNCSCRKPKTGLFLQAEKEFGKIDFKNSYFIGDSQIDIEAGKKIGAKTILVLSGKTKNKEEIKDWLLKPDFIASNLKESLKFLGGGGEEIAKFS